jgi:hypothetical protein
MANPPNLGLFTIGFVRPVGDRGEPFGSGTLITFGAFEGVLTAAHVLDEIAKCGEIGILEFPVRRDQMQRLRIKFANLDYIRIGNAPYGEHGPDLAFLKLPALTASALKANSSFVSFEKQAMTAFAAPPTGMGKLDSVVGVIENWRRQQIEQKTLIITPIESLLNVGTATEIAPADGYDRFQFEPLKSQDFKPPQSYGGTSGGGFWRSFRRKNPDGTVHFDQLRLMGVAFFETEEIKGQRNIICHGPTSIYRLLADKIRAKWHREMP